MAFTTLIASHRVQELLMRHPTLTGKRSGIVVAGLLCLSAMMLVAAGCKSEVAVGENGESKGGVLRAGLPPRAMIATQGSGTLEYTPTRPGRLFLYDATKDKIVGVY